MYTPVNNSNIHNGLKVEVTQVSFTGGIHIMDYSGKKFSQATTWRNFEDAVLSEISESQEGISCMMSLI